MKVIFNNEQVPSFPRRELADVAALACAAQAFPDLDLQDEGAGVLARLLKVDRAGFTERELRPLAARARVVDDVVRDFFRRHPDGLAIGLFSGPCTRFSRVDDGGIHWVDLDVPSVAEWKRRHTPQAPRYTIAPACRGCDHWIDHLKNVHDFPMLILGLGFSRLGPERISSFLTQASLRLAAGVEILLDATPKLKLRPATLGGTGRLELQRDNGAIEKFPCLRVLDEETYPEPLGARVRGANGVARFFRGGELPLLRHIQRV